MRLATSVCAARPRARLLGELAEQLEPAADRDGQARLERPCSAAGQRCLERDRCLRICARYLHRPDGAQTRTATRNPRTGVRGLRERGVCKEERRWFQPLVLLGRRPLVRLECLARTALAGWSRGSRPSP